MGSLESGIKLYFAIVFFDVEDTCDLAGLGRDLHAFVSRRVLWLGSSSFVLLFLSLLLLFLFLFLGLFISCATFFLGVDRDVLDLDAIFAVGGSGTKHRGQSSAQIVAHGRLHHGVTEATVAGAVRRHHHWVRGHHHWVRGHHHGRGRHHRVGRLRVGAMVTVAHAAHSVDKAVLDGAGVVMMTAVKHHVRLWGVHVATVIVMVLVLVCTRLATSRRLALSLLGTIKEILHARLFRLRELIRIRLFLLLEFDFCSLALFGGLFLLWGYLLFFGRLLVKFFIDESLEAIGESVAHLTRLLVWGVGIHLHWHSHAMTMHVMVLHWHSHAMTMHVMLSVAAMRVVTTMAAMRGVATIAANGGRHVTITSGLSNCITESDVHSLAVLVVKVAHFNSVNLIVMVCCAIAHFMQMDGLTPVHLVSVNELSYLRRSCHHVAIVRIVAAIHTSHHTWLHHAWVVALLEASSDLTSAGLLRFVAGSLLFLVLSGLAEFKAVFVLLNWL